MPRLVDGQHWLGFGLVVALGTDRVLFKRLRDWRGIAEPLVRRLHPLGSKGWSAVGECGTEHQDEDSFSPELHLFFTRSAGVSFVEKESS